MAKRLESRQMVPQKRSATLSIPVIIRVTLICCRLAAAFTLTGKVQSRDNQEKYTAVSDATVGSNVCEKEVCTERAKMIASYINESSDPCDDFYGFVCGKWKAANPLPNDATNIGTFQTLRDNVNNDLGAILNESAFTFHNQTPLTKAVILYRTCLNEENLTEAEREKAVSKIRQEKNLTGWPRLPNVEEGDEYDKGDAVEDIFYTIGWNYILATEIELDPKNSSKYVITLYEEANFMVGEEQLLNMNDSENTELFVAYKESIKQQMMYFNKSLTEDTAGELANALIEVQVGLAKIATTEDVEDIADDYTNMTLGELQQYGPLAINWTKLLNKQFSEVNITLTPDERIVLWNIHYYCKLQNFLKHVNKSALFNFIGWTHILSLGQYASKNLSNSWNKFLEAKYHVLVTVPVWEKCLHKVKKTMGVSLGRLYVQQNFSEAARNETSLIVNHVKAAFSQRLLNRSWMDNETKKEALKKMETMILNIGFPEWIFNDTILEDAYHHIGILQQNMTFLEMNLKAKRNVALQQLEKLRQHHDKYTSWNYEIAGANAFYSVSDNEIVLLAGILQSPFFRSGLPPALNFGGIGTAIGHEITHAFDETGGQFDSQGNLENWWTNDTREKFHNLSVCFRRQYNCTFDEETGMYLNGDQTFSENIAENGGIRSAFKAYKEYVRANKTLDQSLPSLNYSSEQLFFIAYGMDWCETTQRDALVEEIKHETHTPQKYRVNVGLTNVEEFAEAFQCQKDSKMVAKDKCEMW